MDEKKLPYEKAEMEIIDLSGAEDFFRASDGNTSSGGDSCRLGGSQDGDDNDT